jgi:hypothetical protein
VKDEKTALLFGVHMHQPVDNFDEAIERAVESCYAPFFRTMRKYPAFRFGVHCSGWLLEKIRRGYPDVFGDMKSLNESGAIEFLTAGYFEPILSAIPSCDRIGQIEKLSCAIEKNFAQTPAGLWLTERVWESGLIPDLTRTGVRYALVDDYHFIAAGYEKERLGGYYHSEEGGEKIALFPISQALRYALPFKPVETAIGTIKACRRDPGDAAIIFDDAEKFGMWPGTHRWVYEKGWLEAFVEAVLNDEAIETMHYKTYLSQNRAKGIAYLPNVSYYEMGEWSLKADDALALERFKTEMGEARFEREGKKFLKGGIWKNFFVKYEESNRLHKRMVECSKANIHTSGYLDSLYALQTNDVFWHGIFGGIYLPNLRDNAYRYLISCENMRYGGKRVVETADIDMNGYEEVKYVGEDVIMRFDSRFGGQMVEFDDRKSRFNFQNVLTRRKEAYHEKLLQEQASRKAEESGLEDGISTIHTALHRVDEEVGTALVYDWYLKNSFVDHISDHSLDLESFRQCSFREFSDFANQPFDMEADGKGVTFVRNGGIYDEMSYPTRLQKRFDFVPDGTEFSIDLESDNSHIYEYGMEFNFHFANLSDLFLNGEPFSRGTHHELKSFSFEDPWTRRCILFELDHFFTLLATPLQTVSQSEQGFELMTQGVSLMAVLPFSGKMRVRGSLKVRNV